MKLFNCYLIAAVFLLSSFSGFAQKKNKSNQTDLLSSKIVKELKFRNIGPAFMSGRIADIAIHPENSNIWYIAVGSGGVWKTDNSGVSWKALFDSQEVYSTGCISIDPNNPHTIWVGTGENIGGRHVGFGDGIYKSTDDGKTWKNMGLKNSEHISEIIIHPENSDIIWLAVQGPLWSKGGERGLYKSVNGGKTWKKTLGDNMWTGVTEIEIDPNEPNRLYAVTWQRHRNVASYMGGGPGSGIWRSEDAGETWMQLKTGLPKEDKGKIGMALSSQNPDVIYATIELERGKRIVYRSENRGESWKKRSQIFSQGTGPHYYQELYTDPHIFDKIYIADVRMHVSIDGGKTFRSMTEKFKHSDNHAIAFRANDPNYLLVGTDGGLYESFDNEKNWRYISNLPITQFYKIAVDDSEPFYQVYGGTQDNSTQAGPSRTDNRHGISNSDWEIVLFADGHQPATEPGNPDIMYAEWQEGNLVRVDRTTGEIVFIQPQPEAGEGFERFNWDAPILISPHSPTRLYFASNRVWRSDNRGDDWKTISEDLTKNQERFDLPIMGKKQSWDAAWDVSAMSTYNTITSLAESPKSEGLIYAGTDDGLIQVTENGGKQWRKINVSSIPGVPATAFVNDIKADLHDANTVFIALDNHKFGDFKPYLYKSNDRGKTWQSIKGDLPAKLLIWRLVQDHVNKNLLFIGTEFGIYFSINSGKKWIKFTGGLPTISIRDLAVQKRENDLVAASFGRGIYILDDYSPLRELNEKSLKKEAVLFKPKTALWYMERGPLGWGPKGSQGETYFTADNPPFGAVFTYYLKDSIASLKSKRILKEKKLKKEKADIPFPGWDALDKEIDQQKPKIFLTVLNSDSKVVRRITAKNKKGINRVTWDLTINSKRIITFENEKKSFRGGRGFMVAPGMYKVFLSKETDGIVTGLSDTLDFEVKPLRTGSLKGSDYSETASFWKELSVMQGKISVLYSSLNGSLKKMKAMYTALNRSVNKDPKLNKDLYDTRSELLKIKNRLYGSSSKREVGEKFTPTINDRMNAARMGTMNSTYGPTKTHKRSLEIAKTELNSLTEQYKKILSKNIPELEKALKEVGAPHIQGQTFPND